MAGEEDEGGLASLLLGLGRLAEEARPSPRALLPKAFPTRVKLQPPPSGPAGARHRARMQRDAADERRADNFGRASAVGASAGVAVPAKGSEVYASDAAAAPGGGALPREAWEKVLAWAVSMEALQRRRGELEEAAPSAAAAEPPAAAQLAPHGEGNGAAAGSEAAGVRRRGLNPPPPGGMRRSASAVDSASGFWVEPLAPAAPATPPRAEAGPGGALRWALRRAARLAPRPLGEGFDWAAGGRVRAAGRAEPGPASPAAAAPPPAPAPAGAMPLSEQAVRYGLAMLRRGGAPRAAVQPGNAYERRLLADVLNPEDLGSGFADVGALGAAKRALREAVQLPLQRPALFAAGALCRAPKGVLLFGPPGEHTRFIQT